MQKLPLCGDFFIFAGMKKKFLIMPLLLAVSLFAQAAENTTTDSSPDREHRGFYSSVGFGFAYNSGTITRNWKALAESSYDLHDEKGSYEHEFSGFTFPTFNFKFGTALANIIAFHTDFNIGVFSGSMDYSDKEYHRHFKYDEEYYRPILDADSNRIYTSNWELSNIEKESNDAVIARSYLGFGMTVYPFTEKESPMNGFFVGASVGYTFLVAMDTELDNSAGGIGNGFEVEIGKEWWLNKHLSMGFAFTFAHSSMYIFDYEGSENTFGITFRLTRG